MDKSLRSVFYWFASSLFALIRCEKNIGEKVLEVKEKEKQQLEKNKFWKIKIEDKDFIKYIDSYH